MTETGTAPARRMSIFDPLRRDGEQTLGNAMSPQNETPLAPRAEALGAEIIEAGFPGSSPAARAPAAPQTGVPASLREVMARFATGVVVLTVDGSRVHGMTANAFSAVSLDPPQVLCCVAHTAVMHQALTAEGRFGVSILSSGQEDTARYFADKSRPLGPAQFDAVDCRPGPATRAPLLDGALAWLECEVVDAYVSGDHSIFFGQVVSSVRGDADAALLFFDGAFQFANSTGQGPSR